MALTTPEAVMARGREGRSWVSRHPADQAPAETVRGFVDRFGDSVGRSLSDSVADRVRAAFGHHRHVDRFGCGGRLDHLTVTDVHRDMADR